MKFPNKVIFTSRHILVANFEFQLKVPFKCTSNIPFKGLRSLVIIIYLLCSMDSLAQIQEGFVNVENGRLFYQKQGEGQPILFLHGLCLDHRMWDDQIHFFAPQFTCITVDLRGFGKSTVPSAPYSFHEDLR